MPAYFNAAAASKFRRPKQCNEKRGRPLAERAPLEAPLVRSFARLFPLVGWPNNNNENNLFKSRRLARSILRSPLAVRLEVQFGRRVSPKLNWPSANKRCCNGLNGAGFARFGQIRSARNATAAPTLSRRTKREIELHVCESGRS